MTINAKNNGEIGHHGARYFLAIQKKPPEIFIRRRLQVALGGKGYGIMYALGTGWSEARPKFTTPKPAVVRFMYQTPPL